MPFTPHEIMIERCDKYLSDVYWRDTNLHSVLYEEKIPIEDINISVYEVPGTDRPLFHSVVPEKRKQKQTILRGPIDRPIHSNASNVPHIPFTPGGHCGDCGLCGLCTPRYRPSSPSLKGALFTPLSEREGGRSGFGPAWSTKWFKLHFKLTKAQIRQHRNRIALRWDSQSEAMLYTSKGRAVSSYTGSDGCDRREIVYLGSTIPKLKPEVQYNAVKGDGKGGRKRKKNNKDGKGDGSTSMSSSDSSEDESDDNDEASTSPGRLEVEGEIMDSDSLTGADTYVDDLELVELTYYMEMACCGKFGNGDGGMIAPPRDRTFDLKLCELVVVNDAAMALYWDMHVLMDIAKELPPPSSTVGVQAANLTSVVINNTDLSSRASLLEARRAIASSGLFMETKTMKDSYTQSRSNVSRFMHSESVLNGYRETDDFKVDHQVVALGHCHIDLAWLWPYAETRRKVVRSWASQLELMERHRAGKSFVLNTGTGTGNDMDDDDDDDDGAAAAGRFSAGVGTATAGEGDGKQAVAEDQVTDMPWRFVASQAVQWEWLQQDNPELFHRVKKSVRWGLTSNAPTRSFVPVGNAYTEFDANLPSGESMVRQFLYGRSYFMRELGICADEEEEEAAAKKERDKKRDKEKKSNKERKTSTNKWKRGGVNVQNNDASDSSDSDSTAANGKEEEEEDDHPLVRLADRLSTPTSGQKAGLKGMAQGGKSTPNNSPAKKVSTPNGKSGSNNPSYAQSTSSSRSRSLPKPGTGLIDIRYRPIKYEHCPAFWLPDTFGYSGNLPQIMRGFNIPYFVSQKLSWNLHEKFPHSSFVWEGIDGSGVIAHFPPADNYNCLARANEVLKSATNHSNSQDSRRSLLLFGHGDGGGGPCEEHIQHLSRLRRAKGMPVVDTTATLGSFFQGIEKDFGLPATLMSAAPAQVPPPLVDPAEEEEREKERARNTTVRVGVDGTIAIVENGGTQTDITMPAADIGPFGSGPADEVLHQHHHRYHYPAPRANPPPKWRGELYLQLHQGTLTSQALTKRLNRACEQRLRTLEALLVFAALDLPALSVAAVQDPAQKAAGMSSRSSSRSTTTKISRQTLNDTTVRALKSISVKVEALWKEVLLNQFHDVLPGSSIGMVYKDCNTMLASVMTRSYDLCQQLMELLVPTAATTASSSLVLRNSVDVTCIRDIAFNGTGHDRNDYSLPPLTNVSDLARSEVHQKGNNSNSDPFPQHTGRSPEEREIRCFAFNATVPVRAERAEGEEEEEERDWDSPSSKPPPPPASHYATPLHSSSSSDAHHHHNHHHEPADLYVRGERLKRSGKDTNNSSDCYMLENAFLRVVVTEGGLVRSMLDLRCSPPRELMQQQSHQQQQQSGSGAAAAEYWDEMPTAASTASSSSSSANSSAAAVSGEGNLLCLHEDKPFFWDAWDVFPYHLQTGAPVNGPGYKSSGSKIAPGGSKKRSVAVAVPTTPMSAHTTRLKAKKTRAERPLWDNSSGTGIRVVPLPGSSGAGTGTGTGPASRVELVLRVPVTMPADATRFGRHPDTYSSSHGSSGGKGATGSGATKKSSASSSAVSKKEEKRKKKEEKELSNLMSKASVNKKGDANNNKKKTKKQQDEESKAAAPAAAQAEMNNDEEKRKIVAAGDDPSSPGGSVSTAATSIGGTAASSTVNTNATNNNANNKGVRFPDELDETKQDDEDYTLLTISLDASSALLSFSHHVSWRHKQHKILKVSFPLALQADNCLYEIQSGVLSRPTHGNTAFDDARLEVCAQRFAALQEGDYGVALINDGKYGHSCRENIMSLSLLRSPRSPDDECDIGSHSFSYHLLPYFGSVTTSRSRSRENASDSVVEAASRVNSQLMHRDAPQELTPVLQRYLKEDVRWNVQQGPSLARVVPLSVGSSSSSGSGSGSTTTTRGCALTIDAVKVAEGFDFIMAAGLEMSAPEIIQRDKEEKKEREKAMEAEGISSSSSDHIPTRAEREKSAYPSSSDIIVRLVEMGGTRGTAALLLHPALISRVKRCRFVKLDESPYSPGEVGSSSDDANFDYHVPTYDVRGAVHQPYHHHHAHGPAGTGIIRKCMVPGQGPALEIPYQPYKIITVRVELKPEP